MIFQYFSILWNKVVENVVFEMKLLLIPLEKRWQGVNSPTEKRSNKNNMGFQRL